MKYGEEIVEAFEELERFVVYREWAGNPYNESINAGDPATITMWNEKVAEARKKILKLAAREAEDTAWVRRKEKALGRNCPEAVIKAYGEARRNILGSLRGQALIAAIENPKLNSKVQEEYLRILAKEGLTGWFHPAD
jgi:hypothetical protein